MQKIRITKQFSFETGHALHGYDGKCKNIHGHSYRLDVTVIGKPVADESNPKCGMVIDFSDLKKIATDEIVDVFDHEHGENGNGNNHCRLPCHGTYVVRSWRIRHITTGPNCQASISQW